MSTRSMSSWVFTQQDLQDPSQCNAYDEFMVTCPIDDDPLFATWQERGIIVYRNGIVSNRYADGTVGISTDEKAFIEDGECATYKCGGTEHDSDIPADDLHADTWRYVEQDDKGNFKRFISMEEYEQHTKGAI